MIYLVRHGQTDWNLIKKTQGQLDIPLNETGRVEAQKSAELLMGKNINQIISSDLKRTVETAHIINRHLGVPMQFDERLRELNYGSLQGTFNQNISPETWKRFNYYPEEFQAEDLYAFYMRIKSFFDDLDDSKNTLVVTHGGTIRMMMLYAKNKIGFERSEFVELYTTMKIKNASVFEWDRNNDEIQPVSGDEK